MSDVYDVLGVARDAGPAQIKSAYRRLAKVYHPDVRGGDGRAERRFKEIARAYETLSRPEIRAAYDAGWASARAVARRRARAAVHERRDEAGNRRRDESPGREDDAVARVSLPVHHGASHLARVASGCDAART